MLRLGVRVRAEEAELVLAELLELAPGGVEEVTLPGGIVEYAVYGPPGELPELPDLRAAAGGALVEVSTSEVADDWSERWREFHRPLVLPGRLTVRPPWEPAGDTPLDVVIDPGQAFGTGAHATTRLCLELLLSVADMHAGSGLGELLDLGCGSGVLAIVAARLGFAPVRAVDYDPLSVSATRANAALAGVPVEVAAHDLRSDPLLSAPTVLANLLGPLLIVWASRLATARATPGRVIASGLLVSEIERVAGGFAAAGLRCVETRTRAEWAALLLER